MRTFSTAAAIITSLMAAAALTQAALKCGAGTWVSRARATPKNEPIYCPYCGADIDIADIEEDENEELDYDEDDYQS
mgnify:CR=1 FL=1